MNYTLLTFDRSTHLRIVCVALLATILVGSVCGFARISTSVGVRETSRTAATPVVDRVRAHFSAATERTPL